MNSEYKEKISEKIEELEYHKNNDSIIDKGLELLSELKQALQLHKTDVIARFSNSHGWINYSKFNEWMTERGFNVTKLERHNMTDGEVHFRYRHKITSQTFDFNGNYWSGESFEKVVDWLNQNGL